MTGSDRPDVGNPGSLASVGMELAAVVAVMAALVGGIFWWLMSRSVHESSRDVAVTRSATRDDAYVGPRACSECHPGEAALHDRSGHSRTLRPAGAVRIASAIDGRSTEDAEYLGAFWTHTLRDGHLDAERVEGDQRASYRLDYALGSGHHAMTFISLVGNDPHGRPFGREHRLTYFAHLHGLDITPGQYPARYASGGAVEGRYLNADETRICLACHATRVSRDDPSRLDVATMIANVSCERCHGPGGAHVEAARRGDPDLAMPFGHGEETAGAQLRLCGQCHRLPEHVPPDELRPERTVLPRFQPVGLMQSKCYTQSAGSLSCTTCHDPHARTSRDRPAYEGICLSCHQSAPRSVCSVSPRSGCLDCHMPRRNTGNGMLFSDHWIRIIPPETGAP